jgi:hypothetical protein
MLITYAVSLAVLAVLVGPLVYAVILCRRICRGHAWPGIVVLAVAGGFSLTALVPFAFYGASWGLMWFVLCTPFAMILELFASLGFAPFAALTTAVGALFWGTLAYVICALTVWFRRKKAEAVAE